jgi:hypothetical protein
MCNEYLHAKMKILNGYLKLLISCDLKLILKRSDDSVEHKESLGLWTLSINKAWKLLSTI